jgi:hypothetical protein
LQMLEERKLTSQETQKQEERDKRVIDSYLFYPQSLKLILNMIKQRR